TLALAAPVTGATGVAVAALMVRGREHDLDRPPVAEALRRSAMGASAAVRGGAPLRRGSVASALTGRVREASGR
ncbi:hypothetical protein ND748_18280, partial [Frankia sp. AiPs1]|uniref:hypothetical protein n=1 Tax=Frankia sp. AiPs1 TaxID=573493 RepID=UPI0020440D15